MTTNRFFEMVENANEFKALIGEHKTKISIIYYDNNIGCVCTFEEFEELLGNTFCEEAKKEIINSTISDTISNREFRIFYWFDKEPRCIKLFVE